MPNAWGDSPEGMCYTGLFASPGACNTGDHPGQLGLCHTGIGDDNSNLCITGSMVR
jgi:hypothetical protein